MVLDPVRLLSRMIAIDSVNPRLGGSAGGEAAVAELLAEIAVDAGLTVRRLPLDDGAFNLLVECRVQPAAPWLLFDSHLDTVGVEQMTVQPFQATVADGRITGRGACDTKGGGAAMLTALADYAVSPGSLNAAILFCVDEEVSKQGVRAFVDAQLPGLGWRPAGVIVAEPTGLAPVVAHNGVARWPIRTFGRAAHSSAPALGRSAISAMVEVIADLERNFLPRLSAHHPLTGPACGSINLIRGGVAANIVPESCEALLDRRLVPGESAGAARGDLAAHLAGLARADLRVELGPAVLEDPPLTPLEGPLLPAVQAALARFGRATTPLGVPYGTDASTYSAAGIAAIVLGPGDIAQAHTADEWLALAELRAAVDIYRAILYTEARSLPPC